MSKTKQITINQKEQENTQDGIFLVNPQWIHLDENEIREHLEKNDKIFKVNFEDEK